MKHYKIYTEQRERVSHETCDKCGKIVESPKSFHANEFKLEWRVGDSYPEGGSGDIKEIDLCFRCRDDLFIMLSANGYNVQSREYDY